MAADNGSLLQPPSWVVLFTLEYARANSVFRKDDFSTNDRVASTYTPLHTFDLGKGEAKHYQQQFADMYFTRLTRLKPAVEQIAAEAWDDFEVHKIHLEKMAATLIKGS